VSRKRVYDHNESNDEQPSAAVVVVAAAETSKEANATVELESTRRMSSRTKKNVNYSLLDDELANSPSMSETGGDPPTSSNMIRSNGAEKRAAAESTEKATPKSTSKLTNMTPNGNHVNGRAQGQPVTKEKM
jgi:hypothetical protein